MGPLDPCGLSPQDHQGGAAPVGALAVIALVAPCRTGGPFPYPAVIEGGGHAPGPVKGGSLIGDDLVFPHQEPDLLMSVKGPGQAVTHPVDVDNSPVSETALVEQR